ncbi:MAG: M20/M25/M40 family metallo-hydrolase [bacterium]|nr:M20/M25/M40 family metallo-hydrolase [bacterium]
MRYTMAMRRTSPLRLVTAAAALVCMAGLAAAPAKEASMSTSEIPSATIAERGRAIVEHLAGTIGPRSLSQPASLEQAALYIEERFAELGYTVERQPYKVPPVERPVRNLIVEKTGRDKPKEIILFGAHYDTVPTTPGADDNASGVAGLLELARLLKPYANRRTIRLVAFTCEEPPYFKSRWMGSRVYAREARRRGDDIIAMVSLEMIGFFDSSISQGYPIPFMRYFYPNTADFVGVVGNISSRRLVTKIRNAMRQGGDIGVESIATVKFLPGLDWSDHGSFWRVGYEAVMITDTAFYRSRHYHSYSDTPETLNYEAFAEVVKGLYQAVVELDGGR